MFIEKSRYRKTWCCIIPSSCPCSTLSLWVDAHSSVVVCSVLQRELWFCLARTGRMSTLAHLILCLEHRQVRGSNNCCSSLVDWSLCGQIGNLSKRLRWEWDLFCCSSSSVSAFRLSLFLFCQHFQSPHFLLFPFKHLLKFTPCKGQNKNKKINNHSKLLLPLTPLWSAGCCTSATGHGSFHMAASWFLYFALMMLILPLNCLTGTVFVLYYQSMSLKDWAKNREVTENKTEITQISYCTC